MSGGEDVEKLEALHTAGGMETSLAIPEKAQQLPGEVLTQEKGKQVHTKTCTTRS